jgi:hypothetical protein
MREGGVTYFCHTDTSAHIPFVTILTMANVGCNNDDGAPPPHFMEDTVRVVLPHDTDNLREGMREAVMGYIHSGEDMYTQKLRMSTSADEFDAAVTNMANSPSSSSSRGDLSPNKPNKGGSDGNGNGKSSTPLEGLSLFDSIMEHASTIAYDSSIGRYISADTVHLSPHRDMIKTDIGYGNVMSAQKEAMTDTVAKTIQNRDKLAALRASRGLPPEDDGIFKNSNSGAGSTHRNRIVTDPVLPCALCERNYKQSRLLGEVTFKTIAEWREARAAPFPSSDRRFWEPYHPVKLCLLCSCFFDEDFSDCLDAPSIHESVGLPVDRVEGIRQESNQETREFLKQMAALGNPVQASQRPLSAMRVSISVSSLRHKGDTNSNENGNANFMYNPKEREPHHRMVDVGKAGHYLKEKYADVIKVKQQQNRGMIEGRLAQERERRRKRILKRFEPGDALASATESNDGDDDDDAAAAAAAAAAAVAEKQPVGKKTGGGMAGTFRRNVRRSATAGATSPTKERGRGRGRGRSLSQSNPHRRGASKNSGAKKRSGRTHSRSQSKSRSRAASLSANRRARSNTRGRLGLDGSGGTTTPVSGGKRKGRRGASMPAVVGTRNSRAAEFKRPERTPLVLVVNKNTRLSKRVLDNVVSVRSSLYSFIIACHAMT